METRDAESGRGSIRGVLASQLTQGRHGAYCRRECARSFWSTANRRPARNGLALHRHLHECQPAWQRWQRRGDLLMRAQSFHGEVNRLEARSSWFAGHGDERIHREPVHHCPRPGGNYLYAGNEILRPPRSGKCVLDQPHDRRSDTLECVTRSWRSGSRQRGQVRQVSFLGRVLRQLV